jgi:fluoride exporter
LFTGVLGGFTTFSAFGLDTVFLLRRGEPWLAATYAGASVLLGIAAVWLGMRLIAAWPR